VTDEATRQSDGEVARSPEERAELEPFVNALEANLTIEPIRETQAIRVSFRHTNSTVAAAVANGIAERFVYRNFKNKIEQFTNAAAWLERSTRELKERAERAEKELAAYTREHNIFPTESKRDETLTMLKLSHLHNLATRAETDRMLKKTLYEEVKAGRIAQMPDAFSDPRLIELQQRLNELQTEEAQLRVKYAAKNPRLIAVQQQIAISQDQIYSSRKSLEEKLKTDYDRAVQDERSLNAALEQVKADAIQENQASFRYNLLKQDVDTTRALYTDFLQKTSQANLKVAEQQKSTRLVESAQVPLKPVGPQRNLITLFGFMISLALGVGMVFLLEYFDNSIKSIEDVSRYVQLPALGIIPAAGGRMPRLFAGKKKGKQQSIIDTVEESAGGPRVARAAHSMLLGDQSPVAEAYRVLRTSVLLSSARSQPKIILVTSSQPGEGKTTTSVNIAISLAQLGESVLIIDGDLRTPSAHELLEVNQTPGLSTYLSSDVQIESLIQKLQIPKLSFLPSGPIPPNPAELVSTKKMKEMLVELAGRYDHILIDSPPLINLADPLILSTLVDGVLLVVHGGRSTRDVVLRAREELLGVGAEIFGVVLNNVDLKASGYHAKHYYRYTRTDGRKASGLDAG
jgi:capsular exopolysaccharide synthesis family protein